jgi:hypothetical protein
MKVRTRNKVGFDNKAATGMVIIAAAMYQHLGRKSQKYLAQKNYNLLLLQCKKKIAICASPAGMSLTKLFLAAGRE